MSTVSEEVHDQREESLVTKHWKMNRLVNVEGFIETRTMASFFTYRDTKYQVAVCT